MRKKTKIKLLEFEIIDLNIKLAHLTNENENKTNNIRILTKSLERSINTLTECDKRLKELETINYLLEDKILKQKELLEKKETQRRKNVGKISSLTKKLNKLEYEKDGQNEMIKSFIKENHQLKDLVKSNKDARTYLKGKSEHE